MANEKGQKDKQRSTKRSSNKNPTKTDDELMGSGWVYQFLLHTWHPSCYCKTTRISSDDLRDYNVADTIELTVHISLFILDIVV